MRSLALRTSVGRQLRPPAILLATLAAACTLGLIPAAGAKASTPTVTLPPTGEVEALLGKTPLGPLSAGKLAEVLSRLPGLEGVESAKLEEALEKTIAELKAKGATLEALLDGGEGASTLEQKLREVLGPLAGKLAELLGGEPSVKLKEALEHGDVAEILGQLLGGSAEPQTLLTQIIEAIGPERLQSLIGTVLANEPFTKTTVEELARKLGTTTEALAAEFGKTTEQLPGTAMALTAPLANGETLGVVDAAKGVTVGVVKGTDEAAGVTGGNGANGSSGADGAPGATMTVTTTTTAPTGTVAAAKTGKVRVLSHKVKGSSATIVLEVPAAGKLAVSGHGVRSISRETDQAERVTIHPALTKADTASLRKHRHHKLKVPLKVTFKQVGGPTTAATVALTYT